MPLDRHDVMLVLAQLAEEEELRVTVKGSAFGGLVAGLGAFLGGVALGPVGILVGSTAGGGAGYLLTAGKFRSAGEVLRSLPEPQQRQLAQRVSQLVSRLSAQDAVTAITMLAVGGGMADLRSMLISQVVHYLTNELAMEVCSNSGQVAAPAAW